MRTFRLVLCLGSLVLAVFVLLPGISIAQESQIDDAARGTVRELFDNGSISLNREAFIRHYGDTSRDLHAGVPDDLLQDCAGLLVTRRVNDVVAPLNTSMGIAGLIGMGIGLAMPRFPRKQPHPR